MSLLGKLMESMQLGTNDEDDYYFDEEEYDDDKPVKKGLFNKKEEDYYDDPEEEEPQKPRFLSRNKVVPMRRSMEVAMLRPRTIEDAKEICDYLLAGKTVVLNMDGIPTDVAQRIIDFTSGATYSMNGNLQKISHYIFIATPDSVELSGDFQNLFEESRPLDISGLNLRL